jgi:hypothetical protein
MLEDVKAIERRMRELSPVASIACLIAGAFHPANPKLIIKATTMRDVTKVVIRQPWNVTPDQRKVHVCIRLLKPCL